ncbi:hypothetical protein THAOC_25769, partial [Thalassiosira oceanica]
MRRWRGQDTRHNDAHPKTAAARAGGTREEEDTGMMTAASRKTLGVLSRSEEEPVGRATSFSPSSSSTCLRRTGPLALRARSADVRVGPGREGRRARGRPPLPRAVPLAGGGGDRVPGRRARSTTRSAERVRRTSGPVRRRQRRLEGRDGGGQQSEPGGRAAQSPGGACGGGVARTTYRRAPVESRHVERRVGPAAAPSAGGRRTEGGRRTAPRA